MKNTGLKFLWLSLAVIAVDLFTKYLVVQRFELYESVNILPIFNLTYARNYGAAFSFLADHGGWQKYFFIILAFVISIVLLITLFKNKAELKLQNSGYALIIGGALGNAFDRLYHGYVVDFFDFYWGTSHFPIFNVADIAIDVGVGLILLDSYLDYRKKKQK